jgi:Arc/MetJ family transcription regulator
VDSVKTTIDIPDDELADAMRFTGARTKREAVVRAMQEYNRRQRMAGLLKYSGTFSEDFLKEDEVGKVEAARDRLLDADDRR